LISPAHDIMYQALDPAALKEMLGAASPPRLIDVRGAQEIVRGVIPGAEHVELGALPAQLAQLDPGAPVVLYCLSGARSARACAFLAQQGFSKLYHLEGGIAAWAKAGYPTEMPAR
jgi:rhodanese-related sulfurtransferase